MGIGALTLDSAGSVTAPTAFPLVLATQANRAHHDAPWSLALFASARAMLGCNGNAHMSHIVGGTLYRTGLLAPAAALTLAATGSGARSAATFTPGGQPADQTYLVLVSGGDQVNFEWRVYFVTSFITTGSSVLLNYWQVKRGASEAACLDNLKLAINGTGTDGNEYRSPTNSPGVQTADHPRAWSDWVTAETNTNTTQAFQAVAYGTGGNVYEASAGTAGGTFGTSSLFTGGTAMTGTAPTRGIRRWAYGYKRTTDGALSGLSPTAELNQLDDGNVALSVMADPASGQNESVDAKSWFRTLDGGDVYHLGYDVAVADTTDTDDLEDTDGSNPIEDHEEADPFARTYADGFIPRYRLVAEKDGRAFAAGFSLARDYSIGTAAVTNGSRQVTLSSTTHPLRQMEHRAFYVTTDATTSAVRYEIVYVLEGSRDLYLDRPYEGSTNATAAYRVADDRNPFVIAFSEPRLYNVWPPDNEIEGVSSPDATGIVALASAFGNIVAFTRTGIWTLRGESPDTYSFFHDYEGVGCVGARAWCFAEGRLYLLSDDGIYRWDGRGPPTKISAPYMQQGQRIPDGIQGTVNRVNKTYAHLAIGHFDPRQRVVRFFVPLDDDATNRYAIVYDLQNRLWSLDHYGIDISTCVTLADPNGLLHTIAGDIQGDLWELDVSNSDGAYGFEPVAAITSSTTQTVTCSGASFPTSGDGLAGVPVTFVDAAGAFTYNTISSNTGTVLTLARIVATAPTGTAVVGGIHTIAETGRFALGDPARDKVLAFARVAFSPDVDGQFWFSYAFNQGDVTVASATTDGDLTLTDGEEQFWVRQRGRLFRWRLDAVEPGCDPAFLGVLLDVPRREALSV